MDETCIDKVDVDVEDLGVIFWQLDKSVVLLDPVAIHGAAEELGTTADDAFVDGEALLILFLAHDDNEGLGGVETAAISHYTCRMAQLCSPHGLVFDRKSGLARYHDCC